jgi:hypothetical protein
MILTFPALGPTELFALPVGRIIIVILRRRIDAMHNESQ